MNPPAFGSESHEGSLEKTPQAPLANAVHSGSYGPFARWLLGWLFAPVEFPPEEVPKLRALAEKATLVYVLRASSLLQLLYFNFAFHRLALPIARASTGLGYRIFSPFARWYLGGKQVSAPRGDSPDKTAAAIAEAVSQGESALIFLRSPRTLGSVISTLSDPFPALAHLQAELLPTGRRIVMIPLTLLWRRRPRQLSRSVRDVLFGDPEEPGAIRALIGFLIHRGHAKVRVGAPVELAEELNRRDTQKIQGVIESNEGASVKRELGLIPLEPINSDLPKAPEARSKELDKRVARRVRGFLHQHLARESRVITGPPLKRPERVAELTLRDMSLRRSLAEIARERGRADGSVEREARKALTEIAATYNAIAVDFIKRVLHIVFNRIYDGVDVEERGIKMLQEAGAKGPLVLCPCHKSHIDYMILSYVFDENGIQPPHVAAGDNLNFWPVGRFLRMVGAFFIRRSFKGDKVYSATLSAYIKQLLRDGFTQEFFLEGGRSRTGKLLPPKFGMLTMEVEAWLSGEKNDVSFCPISISYEKLVEGQSYTRELLGGEKQKEDAKALLGATSVLRSRYGRITIRFDEPISLRKLFEERGVDINSQTPEELRKLVAALGWRVSAGINRAAPLAPMGLTCAALLSHDRRGLSNDEILARTEFLHMAALDSGARAPAWDTGAILSGKAPSSLRATGLVTKALETLVASGDIHQQSAGGETYYSIPEERRYALDYHKNGILHFLVGPAILASAIRTSAGAPVRLGELLRYAKELSRFFKNEFIYEPGRPFEAIVDSSLALLLKWNLIERRGQEGGDGELIMATASGGKWIGLLADLLRPFGEGVWLATDALGLLLKEPVDLKEWTKLALDRGRAAYLAGRIRRQESLSKPILDNALKTLKDRGVVAQSEGKNAKLSLTPEWAAQEKLTALASEIDRFL
jgi:glycerol-3-phosphate O-acyltransferase